MAQLAGHVAHDLNDRLVAINGFAELLMEDLVAESQKEYLGRILRGARQANDLAQQLLAFAAKGDYQPAPVDIHELIADITRLMEQGHGKSVRIEQNLRARPCIVTGDAAQLRNTLFQLALNGAEAMPEGGSLTFATSVVQVDTNSQGTWTAEVTSPSCLRIDVRDTGIGLTDENRCRIFEPFFTTKEPGVSAGMGLAAVYGSIRHHGGAIEVASHFGEGTTFSIYLPLVNADPASQAAVPNARQTDRHIMVVDDEVDVRDFAAAALRRLGYQVTTCAGGQQAISFFQQNWGQIDLVLLDMVMPKVSGKQVFEAVMKTDPAAKVILVSGYSLYEEARNLFSEGVLDYISKPFRIPELAEKLSLAFGDNGKDDSGALLSHESGCRIDKTSPSLANAAPGFNPDLFCQNLDAVLDPKLAAVVRDQCQEFHTLSTPEEKATLIRSLMSFLDQHVDRSVSQSVMQACGLWCAACSDLEHARTLRKESDSLDDFLASLNREQVGGGHFTRSGNTLTVTKEECGCDAVKHTSAPVSKTFCQCSCGWYKELFESCLGVPVTVELAESIISGDRRCRLCIHLTP